jgi:glucose/mannose transport system substrate-binding protein
VTDQEVHRARGQEEGSPVVLATERQKEELMSQRSWRSTWALLPALAIVFSACSGTSTPTAAPATAAPATAAPATAAPATAAPATAAPSAAAVNCSTDTTKKPIELDSWWTTGGEAHGLDLLMAAFNKANPDLCVYNAAIAGGAGTVAQGRIKAAVLAGLPPDTFQVHMGHELLDTYVNLPGGSLMSPLGTDIIDPAQFPPGVVKIISGTDGKIYSVPLNIHRANELWYNKDVFAANGITAAPTTWDEFNADAAKLKAAGVAPLAVGDGGGGVWVDGMILETLLIGELGADGFNGLWTGDTDWADPKVTAALTEFKTIIDSGWINTDHNAKTWDQAADDVISGKAAMTIMGDWANGEFQSKKFENYGWGPAPGNDKIYQALADSFGLPTKATNQDGAKKLLAYMSTAEAQDIFNPFKGSIPANLGAGNPPADAQQYTDYQKSAAADWKADVVVPSMEHGAAANPAWKSAIEAALTTFVTTPDVAAAQTALVAAASDFVPAK